MSTKAKSKSAQEKKSGSKPGRSAKPTRKLERLTSVTDKLRQQNKKLKHIIEVSPAALMIASAKTNAIVEVNAAWQTILDTDPTEVLRVPDGLRSVFCDEAEFTRIRELLMSGGTISNEILHFQTKSGKLKIVQAHAATFTRNRELFFLFNFCDLTEALSNERALEKFNQKLRNLIQALDASSLVSVTDAQGIIIFVNDHFCEVSEYSREELLGQNHRIINAGFHPREFMRDLWQTIKGGKIWRGEIKNRKKMGGDYWVQSTIIPFLDRNGKAYQYYSIRQDISRRKLYEEELTRNQHALLQAQQLARLGTWEWNPADDRPVWSSEMFRIFGLPPESEAVNFQKIREFYTKTSWEKLEAAVNQTLQTGESYTLECEILREDKTQGWVIASGLAVRATGGRITGLRGTVQDITERKRAEERNQLIVNALPDLIFILDHAGVFLDFHASNQRKLAFPPNQFLGKSISEIFPADLSDRMMASVNLVVTGDEIQSIEYLLDTPKGSQYFEANFSKLDSHRVMAVVRDITERKAADDMVREQATLLDKASDAIIVKTIDHKIIYWNKAAERIYGWTKDEVAGRSTRDFLYEKPEEFDAAFAKLIALGEYNSEMHHITKDRRPIVVESRWTLLLDEQGKAKSVLCIASDITERRKLEQQFLRAQRLESIGTLAGGIAHDLNNVLTPILLATEVMKLANLEETQRELLSTVELSARRGADMVKQVLSFARGVEGNPAPMNFAKLIFDLERIIRDTFPKNIHLSTAVANDLWSIEGDATQLHQVLLNITVNARDALPDGGEINIQADNCMLDDQYAGMNADVSPGNYIRVRLEDNGTGMPAAVLEKIFEPFFTTKDLGKGTGLGLSTSIAIIKGHGGFIRAYSEPNRGTRFHIYLPALLDSNAVAAVEVAESLPRGKGEVILVVDDEEPIRNITKQTLEAFGYRVLVAADGAEGLAVFSDKKLEIALILTDMMMPVLDGLGMIQVIRKLNPSLPMIAASGLDANGKVAKLYDQGVKIFLSKPYTTDQLLQAIQRALLPISDQK